MQASRRLRLAHPNDAFTQCRGGMRRQRSGMISRQNAKARRPRTRAAGFDTIISPSTRRVRRTKHAEGGSPENAGASPALPRGGYFPLRASSRILSAMV